MGPPWHGMEFSGCQAMGHVPMARHPRQSHSGRCSSSTYQRFKFTVSVYVAGKENRGLFRLVNTRDSVADCPSISGGKMIMTKH